MFALHRIAVIAVAVMAASLVSGAAAAAAFSDDFEDGDLAGWSSTGDGSWNVVTDGTLALRQSWGSSSNARLFTGTATWASYTVQARVKPITFAVGSHIGLLARAGGPSKYYRLALLPDSQIQLHAVNGHAVTVLASATHTIDTLVWYTLTLRVHGTQLQASIDGVPVLQATSTLASSGQIGLQTAFATASFDDITVTFTP
ncbi:family 16 glycoside hydrolase [Catelliglobosispora koreensis]|uniref:family 16 glycoside hydrolase n=1 Tax=Catelliglobosispora koreensis TaxID=129052 RepID=UPI00037EF379|nr:family 16 glycoside hydrolase [Catelliglobosispora koreensis]